MDMLRGYGASCDRINRTPLYKLVDVLDEARAVFCVRNVKATWLRTTHDSTPLIQVQGDSHTFIVTTRSVVSKADHFASVAICKCAKNVKDLIEQEMFKAHDTVYAEGGNVSNCLFVDDERMRRRIRLTQQAQEARDLKRARSAQQAENALRALQQARVIQQAHAAHQERTVRQAQAVLQAQAELQAQAVLQAQLAQQQAQDALPGAADVEAAQAAEGVVESESAESAESAESVAAEAEAQSTRQIERDAQRIQSEIDSRVTLEVNRLVEERMERFHAQMQEAIFEATRSLICPITLRFPVDPVIATDGNLYDKKSIQKWFASKGSCVSPMTNVPISSTLYPSIGVKDVIRSLVQNGLLQGEAVWSVQARLLQEQEFRKIEHCAKHGDEEAMYKLSYRYRDGHGVRVDKKESFSWAMKAANAGLGVAMCDAGRSLCQGDGTVRDTARGLALIREAAEAGVEHACYLLAAAMRNGWWGYDANATSQESVTFLEKMGACTNKNSTDAARQDRDDWLRNAVRERYT